MKSNLLVTLADRKYINQAKQLFSSVYWNSGWKGDYMILSHEIPDNELSWFRNKGILIKECTPLNDSSLTYYYSPVVLDKFYLFTEEFKKWKNIIFLDSDIIVKGSLEKLTRVKHFAAAQDLYFNKLSSQFFDSKQTVFNNVTYDTDKPAFNSGVFAFNTQIITPHTFNDLNYLFKANRENFRYLDQATLNLYFYTKWEKISPLYNVFVPFHNYNIPQNISIIILHFITCPDHPQVWENENKYYDEWKSNLEKAEFIDLKNIPKIKDFNFLNIMLSTLLLNIRVNNSFFLKPYIFVEHIWYLMVAKITILFKTLIHAPLRFTGIIGFYMKKNFPKTYRLLKSKR